MILGLDGDQAGAAQLRRQALQKAGRSGAGGGGVGFDWRFSAQEDVQGAEDGGDQGDRGEEVDQGVGVAQPTFEQQAGQGPDHDGQGACDDQGQGGGRQPGTGVHVDEAPDQDAAGVPPQAADHQQGNPVGQTLGQGRAAGAEGAAEGQEDAGEGGHDQAAQKFTRPRPRRKIGQAHQPLCLGAHTARKPAAAKRTM
ncbi:hypothetical protein D3C86_1677860 [compost metagenome]